MHQSEQDIKEEWEIIKRAQVQPDVFGFIYEKYYQQIYLFVFKRVEDEAVSGDLTSQIFLKAMMNLGKYKFKGLPFSAWLYRIASNQVNEFYRNSKKQRVITLEDVHVESMFADASSSDSDNSERVELLIELLNELSQEEVQLIELRFFEQKAFKEVAFILDITENNAKVKTYRILDKLKKKAEDKGFVY